MLGTLTPTTSAAAELLDLLHEEQTRFDTFLTLLTRERDCLRSLSPSELETLTAAKLALLTEIQTLEQRRVRVVASLAAEWGVPVDTLTLQAIAKRMGGPAGEDCRRRQQQLNATLDAIREASAVNGSVISKSLAFLDQALSLVRSRPAAAPIYSPSAGLVSAAHDGALIERKG
ncbi:MAG TPA: flagellar protein FlgN [Nitrospirales bacterium]|nr:flagellar protein FlgN [Nitrospirales bacterium]